MVAALMVRAGTLVVRSLVMLRLLAVVVLEARPVATALAFVIEIFAIVVALLLVFFRCLAFQVRPVLAGFLVFFPCN